jgi:hypothetical protein
MQSHESCLEVKKEYSQKNSSTEETVKTFCDDFKANAANAKIFIRGDAAGSSRSSPTGRTDYEYVCELLTAFGFRWEKQIMTHNPPIVDRVKKLNGWLKNSVGMPRLFVNPSCVDLIKDLSSQETNGRVPSDKGNLGHKADACGYAVFYEDRLQKITPVASRIL